VTAKALLVDDRRENLVALESEAIYQILAGKAGKRPALEGVTSPS